MPRAELVEDGAHARVQGPVALAVARGDVGVARRERAVQLGVRALYVVEPLPRQLAHRALPQARRRLDLEAARPGEPSYRVARAGQIARHDGVDHEVRGRAGERLRLRDARARQRRVALAREVPARIRLALCVADHEERRGRRRVIIGRARVVVAVHARGV